MPAPEPPLVIGIGEVLWDLLPAGKQLGGAPANFAYHAAAQGARGAVVSRVGDDALGSEALRRLAELGVDTAHVTTDPTHPTGTVEVRLDERGAADYVIHERVAWDYIPATAALTELASRADAVCFGTLAQRSPESAGSIRAFLAATRPRGCLRVLDVNLRQAYYTAGLLRELLPLAHVVKLNDEELPVVVKLLGLAGSGTPAIEELLREYPGVGLVALTRGAGGSSLFARDGEVSHHDGFPARTVDTVGAGDAFTAALVTGLLHPRGPSLDEINGFANRLASYVCTQAGATPAVPAELRWGAVNPAVLR